MSITYELRAHSRNVNVDLNPGETGETPIGKHTGYDLITYIDGVPTRIESVDLYRDNGKINFDIRSQLVNRDLYETTGEVFGTYMWYDNKEELVSSYFLKDLEYQTTSALATGNDAVQKFYKIKMEAALLKQLEDNLLYSLFNRNCNTCTNYFGQEYLDINNVCSMFLTGSYVGSSNNFYNPNSTDITDITIKAVREILDKYYSLVGSNVDLTDVNCGVVNQSDGWYAKFSTDDYNYVFAGNGTPNIVDISGDSRIYSISGNSVINAGDGDDVIYGRLANIISAGDGNDTIYAGDQTYGTSTVNGGAGNDTIYGGMGRDIIDGGAGDNTVYLGAGGDTYTGGDGVDIVDGGSINQTIIDSKDTSYKYEITEDLSGDINTIRLRGGNDKYTGGKGKDYVWSGSGDDEINTGAGNDVVYTTDGEETDTNRVNLGSGDDKFYGGSGRDIVDGGSGVNRLYGGSGDDIIVIANDNDFCTIKISA